MNSKEPLAYKVRKFTGQSPFTYSQARDYPLLKLNSEFVPTSKFWNRFNVSNEILIGTRGSGKTILLRMMSYTSLLNISKGQFSSKVLEKLPEDGINYIGFYVPLRLRVLSEIGRTDDSIEERRRFSFLFNCVSAGSVINEVTTIIDNLCTDDCNQLIKERETIDKLKEAWGLPADESTATLKSLQEQIDRLFDKVRADWDFKKGNHAFDTSLLEPIISVLPLLDSILGFESNNTTWIACFDEAEYLNKNLQRVLNTVMRSESRGLAVKIATLPFHYNEFRTEIDSEFVQPEGDDFRFESIDYSWDEHDFINLTDHLVTTRLASTGLFEDLPESNVLAGFVGENAEKDLISIYRNIFHDISDDEIEKRVSLELSKTGNSQKKKYNKGQIKRYKPIYMLKELYKKSREGNTKVPRLSGELMVRRVSDGNVRRFIQICDALFESSRTRLLKPNPQHEAVWFFSKQRHTRSQSVYREGFLLYELLESISNYLSHKLHNGPLADVGVEFTVTNDLLQNEKFKSALEMGVAYSYFLCPKPDLFYGITKETRFRLANAIAAYKWLPMRAGGGLKVSARSEILSFLSNNEVLQPKTMEELPTNMELDFSNG